MNKSVNFTSLVYLSLLYFLVGCQDIPKEKGKTLKSANKSKDSLDVDDFNSNDIISCGDITIYKYLKRVKNNECYRLKIIANGGYFRDMGLAKIRVDSQFNSSNLMFCIEYFRITPFNNECADNIIINERKPMLYIPMSGEIQIETFISNKEFWKIKLSNVIFRNRRNEKILLNDTLKLVNYHLKAG